MRPLVLHYRTPFPAPSETFVRVTVSSHVRYRPVVVTHDLVSDVPVAADLRVQLEPCPGGRIAAFARARLPGVAIRQRRRGLARALKTLAPDIVHAHFGEEGIAAWPAAARADVPLVVTFYGFDATELPRDPRWRRRIEKLLRHVTLVLVEGPHLRERMVALGAAPERVRVQPIPVRLEMFRFRPAMPRDSAVVLQACRFVAKKGVDLTLRAFAGAATGTGARLRLIGDGPERASLERLAMELGIAGQVEFAGMRSHEQYARELAAADVFIHPSRFGPGGDGEGGAPTSLIEAQAVGLPIVSTTHADIPFVTCEDAALLAPENDVERLTASLRHLLLNPGEWAERARAGRRHVEQQHDAAVLAARLESAYDDARAMNRSAAIDGRVEEADS